MGLFGHKYSISDTRLLEGATDHHSHILFGVDDGVPTSKESLTILSVLEEQGLKSLWLTPHTMEDVPNTTDGLKRRFSELKALYNGPIELHLASEYMMDEGTRKQFGTTITLHLSDDCVEFSNYYRISEVIRKYCAGFTVADLMRTGQPGNDYII